MKKILFFFLLLLSLGANGSNLKPNKINIPSNAVDVTICIGATTNLTPTGAAGGAWSSSNVAIVTVSTAGVVTGIAAGSAMIAYTPPTGSAENFSVTVSSNSAPTVTEAHTVVHPITQSVLAGKLIHLQQVQHLLLPQQLHPLLAQ